MKVKSQKSKIKSEETLPVNTSVSHALRGLVITAKLPMTVTVIVERSKVHPMYKKAIKQSKKYLVHDELGVKEGDLVEIVQCKPISRHKQFRVARVVGQDIVTIVSEELKESASEAIAEVLPVEEESVDQVISESVKEEEKTEKPKKIRKEKTS